jgi:hypothetical protein
MSKHRSEKGGARIPERKKAGKLRLQCPPFLLSLLLPCLLTVDQSQAETESLMLPSARLVTPVKLIPTTTRQGPSVTLEYGEPCLAEAGTRLRKLVHNFGRSGFVLVQYQTPYTTAEGHCPNRTLFFLLETEIPPNGS